MRNTVSSSFFTFGYCICVCVKRVAIYLVCGKRRKFPPVVRQHEVFAGDWEIGNAVTVLRHQSPSSNPTPRTLKPQQLLLVGRACGERTRSEADT